MGAFILGDFFSGGSGPQQQIIGEVDGTEIDSREFEYRVEEISQAQKSVGANIDESTREQIRNQVWNTIIREHTVDKEFDKLGLDVSKEEYDDVRFGANVLDFLRSNQQFQDPETGQFNPQNVRQFFAVIQEQYPMFWKLQRDNVVKSRIQEKYFDLIEKGVYVNSVEGKHDYIAKNRQIDIQYVLKRYSAVPDSAVSFTESELEDYYSEHKGDAKYKQEESRSIDYITFDKTATAADRAAIKDELASLKEEFKTAENDTTFVELNSNVPAYRSVTYREGTLDSTLEAKITSATEGTVVGPYEQNGRFVLSKVVLNGKEAEVNARHILLNIGQGETAAQVEAEADSLIRVIKKKNNFEALAGQLSDDRGSASKGGNLDWFGKGQMVAPFEKAAFDARVGEIVRATSQFGVHIIEVLDRREVDKIRLAQITRPIEPSNETVDEMYNVASEFSISNDNKEAFYAGIDKNGYTLKTADDVTPGAQFVPGLGSKAEKVSRWMLGAELGDVSEPLELDGMFVVALLTEIAEKGEPELSQVRDEMERDLIREKKADYLKEQMQGTDLNAIASSVDASVQSAKSLSFSRSNITSAGREPNVVGQACTLPEGAVSVPLKGELGVYVVKVTKITEPNETETYASNQRSKEIMLEGRVQNTAYQAILEQADVKDERYKVFY